MPLIISAGRLLPTDPGRSDGEPDEFQGLAATPLGVSLTWSQLGLRGLDRLEFRRIGLSAFAPPPPPHHHKPPRHRRKPRR